jgi:hypothetical protein
MTRHDKSIAILPLVVKLPFSQNKGHCGKVDPTHQPLLLVRLSRTI